MRIQRKTAMANRQTSKPAKNAVKVDTAEAKKPTRKGERQPRRRSPLVRSRAATALQIDEAAAATALPEAIVNSPVSAANNDLPAQAAAQSAPGLEGADAPTARALY